VIPAVGVWCDPPHLFRTNICIIFLLINYDYRIFYIARYLKKYYHSKTSGQQNQKLKLHVNNGPRHFDATKLRFAFTVKQKSVKQTYVFSPVEMR